MKALAAICMLIGFLVLLIGGLWSVVAFGQAAIGKSVPWSDLAAVLWAFPFFVSWGLLSGLADIRDALTARAVGASLVDAVQTGQELPVGTHV